MTLLAQRHLMLRHAIALAPLIALVAPVDRAEAACDRGIAGQHTLLSTHTWRTVLRDGRRPIANGARGTRWVRYGTQRP